MPAELYQKGMALYRRHRDVADYLFWGVMTTIVNYAVYFACRLWCGIDYIASNVIAWTVAVIFAFVVNKIYVFRSLDWSPGTTFRECWQFVAARLFSGVLETGILKVFVDWLGMSDAIVKIFSNIVVVIANYVFSKFIIFRKKKVLLEKLEAANPPRSMPADKASGPLPEPAGADSPAGRRHRKNGKRGKRRGQKQPQAKARRASRRKGRR